MAVTKQYILKQLARLSAVPFLEPKTPTAQAEFAKALLNYCRSDSHVERVVSMLLEQEEIHNPIAQIAALAHATATMYGDGIPDGCELCGIGPDVETGYMRWGYHVSETRGVYDFAMRCRCARGRYFSEMDKRNVAEKKAAALAKAGSGR